MPTSSGVYFMLDASDSILYIGKAKNLKKRLATYKNAKPGQVPERTIEMLDRVSCIKWEEHQTEAQALSREYDLIREVKPPFNVAGTEPGLDLFIGFSLDGRALNLRLSSRKDFGDGYTVFGSYNHRRKAKAGYCALLRVLYAASAKRERFAFPARITRISPAYEFNVEFFPELEDKLARFLSGKSDKFLHAIVEKLLANERVPSFVHPGLQADIDSLSRFYRVLKRVY